MARHRDRSALVDDGEIAHKNVRVLRDDAELSDALARAAEGARRLHERLAARAERDAWMAEHTGQALAWFRFVRGSREERGSLVVAAPAEPTEPRLRRQRPPAA